jgi:hypothetical protein
MNEMMRARQKNSMVQLKLFNHFWLHDSGGFIAGAPSASLADLLAYEEVVQLSSKFGDVLSLSAFPRVEAWLDRMARLPFHDEAHAACAALGRLRDSPDLPMGKRMAAATKAGLKALAKPWPSPKL